MKKTEFKNTRAHTQYKLKDGTVVPGASTIAKMLDSGGALIHWAWDLGRQGLDYKKVRDLSAEVGTLTHERILAYLKKEDFVLQEYTKDVIDKSDNCLLSFFNWEKNHKLEPILCEKEFVSEKYRFGGTIDFYGKVDGVLELGDYKTGKSVYDSHWIQVALYKILLEENGYKVENHRIINIPRDENDMFVDPSKRNLETEMQIGIKLVEIYFLKKALTKPGI